jgi:quercetin dioxygenase-like cupin family protein
MSAAKTRARKSGKRARKSGKKLAAKKSPRKATIVSETLLKNTVGPRGRKNPKLKYLAWSDVELETLTPLLGRQLIVGHELMAARVLLKKGCIVPLHSHVNEQLTYILDGALKFWIDGKEIVVRSGEVLTIPPGMPHKAEALVDTVDLDIFHPPRADWINKIDTYLKK